MTRGVYVAWLWVLGIALGLSVLVATLGAALRLEPPLEVDCAASPEPRSGHVRFDGCVIDATDAVLVERDGRPLAAVWIVPPEWPGNPVAWTLSETPAHVRWAREGPRMSDDERRRHQRRHAEELRALAPITGWLTSEDHPAAGARGATMRPTPRLSLDRPLEPLSVGGALASALLLGMLLMLVGRRRRWRRAQARWAHEAGLPEPGGERAPSAF